MSQNNPASWTNNEWKFSYEIPEQESGLPGQLSPVGDRQQSPLDMLGAFGEALFSGIFDTLGNIFNGVIEVGGAIAGGLIEGIKGLVGWVGSTIASLFSGGEPRVPPPPIYSEISTDLEGDIKPFVDAFKESQEKAFQAVADAKALRELFDENQKIVSDRIDEADDKIQQVGDVDAKISAEAARILAEVEIHKAATEEALGKAETVREDLAAYKLAADAQIQSALADAKTGLDKLDALEPRVSSVISDLEAYEEATNAKIQDLLGKASGAITDAGQALTQYDDLLSEYEGFKSEASDSLEALRKSSTTQGQKLGAIEDDMPGIKTSITNVFALAETAQETVDNLVIGGRNLATRRNFALNTQHQQVEDAGEAFWTGEPIYRGLKLTTSTPPIALSGGLRVEPGETYTATLWVKGASLEGSMNCNILMYDTQARQNRAAGAVSGDGSEWKRIVVTVTNDTAEAFINVTPYFYLNRNAGEETWFTSPKVERGNKATDWSPAPEDVDKSIAAAQAKADKAEQDAEKKSDDARIAAEKYAKEKSEADAAQALVDATAEAARVAKEAADAAKESAATDAQAKADEAERLAKLHADAQAALAKEQAEENAALDATTKANKAREDAEKEAKRLSDIAAAAAAAAQSTANKAKAAADAAVTNAVVEYAVGTSETAAPTSGWTTATPTRAAGRFTWMRSKVTYGSGQVVTTSAALITGNTGTPGTPGTDGTPGKAGVGVKSTTVTYVTSTSGATAPTSGWTAAVPTLTKGRYLWTKTLWTYTDNSTEIGYSVAYLAKDGSSGTDGLPGKDGVGITGTAITYAKSSSGTSAPSTGWVAQPPATNPGDFVWTKTVWTYSDKTTETGYTVGKIGNTGAQGVPGAKGTDGKTTYTWIKYADTAAGVGISNDPTGKLYIGFAYNRSTATESSTPGDYTWSLVKGEQGDKGVPGAKGSDGQTTYTWIKYSDNANGSGLYDTPKASTKFIGIAVNKTTATESSTASNYTWSQFKGDAGVDGDDGVSITAVTSYYRLVTKGASAPAAPTTATPSGWTTTEPGYVADRELYRADKVTYSNGAFTWTDVSRVSAYTAASQANDKLPGMQEAITVAHGKAEEAQRNLDNLTVGGRNYFLNSGGVEAPVLIHTNSGRIHPTTRGTDEHGAWIQGINTESSEWSLSTYMSPLFAAGYGSEYSPDFQAVKAPYTQSVELMCEVPVTASLHRGEPVDLEPGVWTRVHRVTTDNNQIRPGGILANGSGDTPTDTRLYHRRWKLESGSKATDWTPAPEDTVAGIAEAVQASADALNTYRTANDKAVSDANDAAAAAAGVAKDKGEVIYQSAAPTGARATKANLWIRTSDNKPHTYNGSKWVEVTDKVATDAADKAATALSTAQKKTTTYYGSAAPTGTKTAGDLWLDSGSDNALKRWSGSAWVEVRDGQLAKAIKAAGDAQSTADGKVRSFARSTAPTGMTTTDVGDIWLDTDDGNKMYRWSGTSWVTMQDHLAVQAKSVADTATTKAETAQSTVDNLKVGGRNLLRDSKLDIRNNSYQIARVNLAAGHDLQANETVTLAIKGQLGEGKTQLTVHNSQTQYPWLRFSASDQDADGVYRITTPFAANQVNSHLFLYTVPSTVTTESSIEWVKLERGNRATDWSPAPEDVDKSIADVDYKASETGKLIPGMQDSLNIAHSKAETAQSTVDNLQIGGRNLAPGTAHTDKQAGQSVQVVAWSDHVQSGVYSDDLPPGITIGKSEHRTATERGRGGGYTQIQEFYLEEGQTYTVSFWGKCTEDWNNTDAYLMSVNRIVDNRYLASAKHSLTTEWKRYSETFTVPAELSGRYRLRSIMYEAKEIWISHPKLEVGHKVTDWTPAPEDVDAEIQAQANALAGYQLSNDKAVDAAKKSAQDAAGLAGDKGEVIYSTTTPPTAKRSAANLWIKGPKNTPHVWNGSAWVEITDQAAKDAAKAAADANTLAETKTTTYYQTSAPSGTKTAGDLWIDQSTAGKNTLKRWSGSAWVVVQDKAIAEAMVAAGTAQSTADEKVRTFARTTAPTGMKSEHVGDLWIDTDDGNKLWRWSGTAWVGVQDAAIAAAKKAADDAAASQRIKDTRNDNELPDFYWKNYKQTTVREFKSAEKIGTSGGYGVLTTVVPWTDSSGGSITQEFNVGNSDAVLYRRSAGSGATATWTAWKDQAKDLADSITSLGNDLATKTGPNSTLQTNINKLDKATDDQYKKLNNQLWGSQGELNKLNSLLWNDQGKLNNATEIFKSNITGWQKDVYEAFVSFDGVNKRQDGLIAANNRAVKANTEAVSAHQRILQVAYPDGGSAIPMVPGGVNVGTEDAPVYEAMPEWLNAYGVTKVTGTAGMDDKRAAHSKTARTVTVTSATKVKANATALYRYSFWVMASAAGSEMFIRLRDQNGAGAVLENTPDAGMPAIRTSANHLYWFTTNVPTAWKKISGTIRLNPDVTHVYIQGISLNYQGTVTSQWLADIQLEPIIPSQSEVNRALSEVNDAQTAILSSQQDVLDMAFPNTNLVPMTNGVPAWTSTVSANPIRTSEGNWRFTSAAAIQPGTGSKHVPTVNGVIYRAVVRARRTGSDGTFSMRLRKAGGTTNVSLTAVTGKPAPAGASRVNFLTASQTAGTDWTTWYYDFTLANNTGDVRIGYVIGSIGVEVSQLSVVALLPSQTEVDAVQDEAAESNRKAIDALERTVRLSFPHINTLPYSGGNPLWQSRASWITRTTAAANLPPMGQRTEPFSSLINGDGTMTRNAASSVAIPDDVSELRIRGLLRSNGGFFPIVDLHNDAGASIISAWRRTFPTDDEVSLSGRSEIWYSASSAGGYSVDGNNTDPWQPFDIIVQVKPGSKNFHIKLSSTSLIAIHGLAVFSYYPSQSEVDFAQDRAMRALSGSVDLATSIGTAAATAAANLGAAQTAMQMSLVTTASYIPRVMIVKNLGNRSAHERSEHVQVRKDGSTTFLIDARGSSWTGLIVATAFYGSDMVTHTFEITPGGSRTNGVPKRVGTADAKHLRIDYWVNPAVETKEVVLGGTDVPHDRWTELAGTSFTATGFVPEQGAALPVLHIAELAVGWNRATHHAKYGAQIKLDGIVVATLEETRVGPRYPWGQPYAKQVVSWSGQVMPNQKITFEVLSNDTVPSQRRLRDATRLVSYTKEV